MDRSVDVVLPCLDEASALPWVLSRMPLWARAIVVDNGSMDGSPELATSLGATVVHHSVRGYGAACHAGLEAATAPLVAVMDCDATLDPQDLAPLVDAVAGAGGVLAVGRRVPVTAAAWPWPLRLANRVVAHRVNRRTGLVLADIGPMRVASREDLLTLGLRDRRSGYPVETVVRAAETGWRVVSVDVPYVARRGRSKVTGTPMGAARAVRDMTAVLGGDRVVPDVVVVLAKSPVAGRVKTRLRPTFSAAEAAALAGAAIRDTLDAVAELGPRRTVVAWDGPPVPWLSSTVCVMRQRGSTLDDRLENVFEDVYASEGNAPATVLLVGMDTPQLTAADLDVSWDDRDAVVGPSCDGGYWAIGFRRHVPGAIRGIPMSTSRTGAEQLARLRGLELRVGMLPPQRDVDDAATAAEVATTAPGSRFARLHRRLVGSPCSPTTLFDAALAGASVEIRVADDKAVDGFLRAGLLDASAWGRLTEADEVVVSRCEGPVLDVGCGPGRFVEALASHGIPALGVDLSGEAVGRTRDRGGSALVRDVHHRLPGEGRWGTVLLADGNIGIGGDPEALLRRCRSVLRPGAVALVETSPDRGHDVRTMVTLHGPWGRRSHPVPWAVMGARALVEVAAAAGFVAVEDWRVGGRAFVMLRHAG